MFDRKPKEPEGPSLLDRVVESGSQRVAILGLHPFAGTRTVLASLMREGHRRSWPLAVTSAPRIPLEVELDGGSKPEPVTHLALPEGAWVATAEKANDDSSALLDRIWVSAWSTQLGPIGIYRVNRGGDVGVHGPSDGEGMSEIVRRLGELSGGMVFVDGAWERRAFASPGTTDGVVLVIGANFSASPERSAAAMRYIVETLTVPPCDEAARVAWEETASRGAAALLDARGRSLGVLPPGLEDPVRALVSPGGATVATIVLPHGLNDDFMIPLVRTPFRCNLVVKDATKISVAPIYFKAWLKGTGRFSVVRPLRIIAAATNPNNPSGPDADPVEFRREVAAAVPGVPVHDVLLESGDEPRRPIWRFWE